MTIEIAVFVVAVVAVAFAAWRVMARQRPTEVAEEPSLIPQRPRPRHFALPPVTIETTPFNLKYVPEMVPPIDRRVLAALVASGTHTTTELPRPDKLARGSIAEGCGAPSDLDDAVSVLEAQTLSTASDLDGAETLGTASDLDDDAMTRTNMAPVR